MARPPSEPQLTEPLRPIAEPLLGWYLANRRSLPWRDSRDPYAIWVSEAMLQQTRVDTVIPYYHRFLTRFPTVTALAEAPQEDVLKLWEGLGYYSRARNLHRAAAQVVDEFDGQLPDTVAQLKTLPGIGPYMAGAVASIAFNQPEPLLDGNVERVLARLYAIRDEIRAPAIQRRLWALARASLHPTLPGDFNQGLMELGATVCHVRSPDCTACPLTDRCAARAEGIAEQLPLKLKKKASPHHHIAVAVVAHENRWLLVRRPQSGLLAGLWEFPGGQCIPKEAPKTGVSRVLNERFGVALKVGPAQPQVKHVFTHRRVTLHPFSCTVTDQQVTPTFHVEHRWVDEAGLTALALPVAHRKIANELLGVQEQHG